MMYRGQEFLDEHRWGQSVSLGFHGPKNYKEIVLTTRLRTARRIFELQLQHSWPGANWSGQLGLGLGDSKPFDDTWNSQFLFYV